MTTNPSKLIDNQNSELADWRGDLVAKLRKVINAADPNLKLIRAAVAHSVAKR